MKIIINTDILCLTSTKNDSFRINLLLTKNFSIIVPKTKTEAVQKEQINQIQKPISVSQPTAPIAAKSPVTSQQQQSQVQAPLPQRQQESIGSISSLNAYDSVNKALNSDAQQQKIGIVNPVVVNKVNKDTILNNLPLEIVLGGCAIWTL